MEERLTSVEAKVDALVDLRAEMTRQFGQLREDLTRDLDRRFGEVDRRFGEVDRRFGDVDRRFGDMDRRFQEVNGWLERLDRRGERQFMWLVSFQFGVLVSVIVALIRVALE
ncbi:MAG: hypothetical protein FJW14_10865 [Acidimicrobiia bacterium]|nr:hypothetical protein [Acidimicrobiia bacterium]